MGSSSRGIRMMEGFMSMIGMNTGTWKHGQHSGGGALKGLQNARMYMKTHEPRGRAGSRAENAYGIAAAWRYAPDAGRIAIVTFSVHGP